MQEKLEALVQAMNTVFPHLNAHYDDGALVFSVDIKDNCSDKLFPKAMQVYLFPHYENNPDFVTDCDCAEVVATIYEVGEKLSPKQKFLIDPECVLW